MSKKATKQSRKTLRRKERQRMAPRLGDCRQRIRHDYEVSAVGMLSMMAATLPKGINTMTTCEHPGCENSATDRIGGISFCDTHEDWAMQLLNDREIFDGQEDGAH